MIFDGTLGTINAQRGTVLRCDVFCPSMLCLPLFKKHTLFRCFVCFANPKHTPTCCAAVFCCASAHCILANPKLFLCSRYWRMFVMKTNYATFQLQCRQSIGHILVEQWEELHMVRSKRRFFLTKLSTHCAASYPVRQMTLQVCWERLKGDKDDDRGQQICER
jgi:hypothetical protein